jgi:hypothetical protein
VSASPNVRCGSWLVSTDEHTVLTALTHADYTVTDVRRNAEGMSGWKVLRLLLSLAHRGMVNSYFHRGDLLWTLTDAARRAMGR